MLICFSGQIASGKTTLSQAIAEKLNINHTGFGAYLEHKLSQNRKSSVSRQEKQDYGQKYVESDPKGFCEEVLKFGGYNSQKDIVVDGIRHESIYNELKELVHPVRVFLIYINVGSELQRENVITRNEQDDLERAKEHKVEEETLNKLPSLANEIIEFEPDFEINVEKCLKLIIRW